MQYVYLLLFAGLIIALCLFINRLTDKLKVPSLLLFIAIGMAAGVALRPVFGNVTDYAMGNVICSVCLVLVIFYGGFGTNFKEARPVAGRALLLSFAGTALTAGMVGAAVWAIFRLLPFTPDLGWAESLLIGSVISSTDAASVFNILRSRRLNLKYGTSSLLEMESGSNDPMSYMLTVVFTAVIAAQNGIAGASQMGAGEIIGMLFSQVGFGALFGAAFGFLSIFILKKFSFNMGQGGTIFVLAIIAICKWVIPRIYDYFEARRKAKMAEGKVPMSVNMLVVAIIVCLAMSALAEIIGLAAIIGAFLAGMMFADHAWEWDLEKKIDSITTFMLSFFFLNVGMQVDLNTLSNGSVLLLAAVVIVLAVIGKYIGCSLGSKMGDRALDRQSLNIIGFGMVPRGEVGIIVASIGLSSGAMSSELYAVVVLMSVITTLIAPPIISKMFRSKYHDEYKILPEDRV